MADMRLAVTVVYSSREPRHKKAFAVCVTLSYMKGSLTIRLDEDLARELDRLVARTGQTRSEIAREALRRQLTLLRFEGLRDRVLPFAEARGLLTDEDVQDIVS
ncbi:MAG: hypothetical protein Kow00129_08020 [Thermoleophilia bacterium]